MLQEVSVEEKVNMKLWKDLLVCELEAKPSINHSKCYDNASKPKMSIRPEGTALVLLEEAVVDISKEWLEEDEDEQHNTNDGMSVIEL